MATPRRSPWWDRRHVIYPSSHRALTHEIRAQGVVVSELPLRTPRSRTFSAPQPPDRRPLEGRARRGSGIEVRFAHHGAPRRRGRPRSVCDSRLHPLAARQGCHRLIRDGAKLVESAQDVLEDLGVRGARSAPGQTASMEPARTTAAHPDGPRSGRPRHAGGTQRPRPRASSPPAPARTRAAQHIERLPGNRYRDCVGAGRALHARRARIQSTERVRRPRLPYENYGALHACPDADSLTKRLTAAGFDDQEITEALAWLSGLEQVTQESIAVGPESDARSASTRRSKWTGSAPRQSASSAPRARRPADADTARDRDRARARHR